MPCMGLTEISANERERGGGRFSPNVQVALKSHQLTAEMGVRVEGPGEGDETASNLLRGGYQKVLTAPLFQKPRQIKPNVFGIGKFKVMHPV